MNNRLPYHEIPSYPSTYTSGNTVGRFIDTLEFRYYWATEGLSAQDLKYRPSEGAMSLMETVYHIYDIINMIESTIKGEIYDLGFREKNLDFECVRATTLQKVHQISNSVKTYSAEDMELVQIRFLIRNKQYKHSFWHVINGPISDCHYHAGQIVSFRRTCGNSIDPDVRVFLGKKLERKTN